MKTRKAVYAASLDPITNGHLNIIERSAPLYDELYVLVAVDPRKAYTFNSEERALMTKSVVAHLPNVTVKVCDGQYIAKFAESVGANVIIRGLRNYKDLNDEQTLAEENRKICPGMETLWMPCLPEFMHVSSSMVKGHVGVDPGWVEQSARSIPAIVAKKLKEKYILGEARKYWDSLMKMVGDLKGSNEIFAGLVKSYGEPHRGYHTLEHIVSMLDEFEGVRTNVSDPIAILFAIWYHDKVYDTDTKDHPVIASNEMRSAYEAKRDIDKLGLVKSLGTKVVRGIRATDHRTATTDPDEMNLLDLDLAILGKPEKEFDSYEAGIRKEYHFIPYLKFAEVRAKILRSLLERPSIYLTKYFINKYEIVARENLKRSIKRLEEYRPLR